MSKTRPLQPGDRSRAICDSCAAIMETVIARRDVPLNDGSGIAEDALAAICTSCDEVVAMPAQELRIVANP